MRFLLLRRVLVIIIVITLASCLGDETHCEPHDFLADRPCQPCIAVPVSQKSCRMCQMCHTQDRRSIMRHVAWRPLTFSNRRRITRNQKKIDLSSGFSGSKNTAVSTMSRDLSASSGSWSSELELSPSRGLENSLTAAGGTIKLSSRVGAAVILKLFIFHIVLLWLVDLFAWLFCREESLCRYNSGNNCMSFFLLHKKAGSLNRLLRSISHVLRSKEMKEILKKYCLCSSESDTKKMLSQASRNHKEYSPYSIPSFLHKVSRIQSKLSDAFDIQVVQTLSIPRLASFQKLPLNDLPESTSIVLLAQAGFKYTGEGTLVSCDGCNSTFEINQFSTNPSSHCYHSASCKFIVEAHDSELRSTGQAGDTPQLVGAAALPWLGSEPDPGAGSSMLSSGNAATNQVGATFILDGSGYTNTDQSPTAYQHDSGESVTDDQPGNTRTESNSICPSGHTIQYPPESEVKPGQQTRSSDSGAGACPGESGASHQTAQDALWPGSGAVGPASEKQSGAFSESDVSNTCRHYSSVFVAGSNYTPDAEMTARHFYGTELFEAEFSQERQRPFRPERVNVGDCEKNPGHFSYRSCVNITMETLPRYAASQHFCRFLTIVSELTVRVVVGYTSPARGQSPELESFSWGQKYRTGTGSAIRELQFSEDDSLVECDAELTPQTESSAPQVSPMADKFVSSKRTKIFKRNLPKAPLKAVRKYASNLKKKKITLYIETNRHIVFDDAEAAETTVEFFFDQVDRKSVYSFKVSHVLHAASLQGGNRSVLVCRTSDLSFVHNLRAKRRELDLLVQQFPRSAREELPAHVFVVHHPHGGEKVYSFGKSIVKKYMLESVSDSKLSNLSDLKGIPNDSSKTRKVLFYTADTCRGSSGAPVIAFRHTGEGADGTPSLAMDLWMHEGKEISGPLNVSAMEACTAADLAPCAPRPRSPPVTLTLPLPGPVVRMQSPTYYCYSSLRKRLESFNGVPPQTFVHSIFDLAKGGFFYAGYGDCVRCFYCGVGLKNWAPHDDIYVEHERLRPNCHFLILQLRAMGATRGATWSTTSAAVTVSQAPPAAVTLPTLPKSPPIHSPKEISSSFDFSKQPPSPGAAWSGAISNLVPSPSQRELTVFPVTGETYKSLSCGEAAPEIPSDSATVTGVEPASSADDRSRLQVAMLQTENAILERPLICKVCNSAPVRELYLPCGHLDSCSECTKALDNCPTCCAQIRATVKIFFA